MTLHELQQQRATARLQLEELIARVGERDMSTEEAQQMTDLQASGKRLASLESRYAALAEFDTPVTTPRRPAFNPTNTREARRQALNDRLRDMGLGKMASDVPLQIQQSPVDSASADAVIEEYGGFVDATGAFDLPAALGVTEYNRTDTNPLKITIGAGSTSVSTYNEGSAPTQSSIPTLKTVSLGGERYQGLTKISIESLQNVAFDVAGAVSRGLSVGMLETQNAAFAAALKAAVQANSNALIDSGSNDPYYTLSRLITKLPAIFQGPGTKFALSPSDLHTCVNSRDLQERPLLDFSAGTLLGKPFVVHESLDRVYYGNWSFGAYRSRSPLFVQVLRELYAEQHQVGYTAYQNVDWAFYAELTSLTKQPVLFSHLDTPGS